MENIELRKYEPSDLDDIERLLRTHFDAAVIEQRRAIFDWLARFNPAGNSDSNYLIAKTDKKIIAYLGRMPVETRIDGRNQKGYCIHDLLVDPEYRKKGLGLLLDNQLQKMWEDETETFVLEAWMSTYTHTFLSRRGHYQLDARCFMRSVNLTPELTRFLKSKNLAWFVDYSLRNLTNIYESVSHKRSTNVTINKVTKFDNQFDNFIENVTSKFKCIVVRHSRYLNWKYVDKPFSDYDIFIAERDRNLAGYMVLHQQTIRGLKVGIIVDVLVDPDDTEAIEALCLHAIDFLSQENVNLISCLLTDRRIIRVFRRHLFFPRRKTFPIMIANLHKYPMPDQITDLDNWFLTYGESDGYLWEV